MTFLYDLMVGGHLKFNEIRMNGGKKNGGKNGRRKE
jgi:hypothetical protein